LSRASSLASRCSNSVTNTRAAIGVATQSSALIPGGGPASCLVAVVSITNLPLRQSRVPPLNGYVTFDPKKEMTIRHRDMPSRSDYELYEGFQVAGWPTQTLSRGEVIVDNGKVLGQAGRGKLLKRGKFTTMLDVLLGRNLLPKKEDLRP